MLRSLQLRYFRSFKDVTIGLAPLTVLVGPNASGKTSVLRALTAHRFDAQDIYKHKHNGRSHIEWALEGGVVGNTSVPNAGVQRNYRAHFIHLDVQAIRKQSLAQEVHALASDGSNLVNVIDTLPRKEQGALATDLANLVPVIKDVDVRPSANGHQRLVFEDRWVSGVWYEANQVSDGTLLTLAILALLYQKDQPSLVAIEEPEHGLHPYLIGEVVGVLRKLARGELGKPVQIVLATQSSELLDHLEPNEVRFMTRDENGDVKVESAQTDTDDWKEAYAAHQQSLGGLWLSGSLGGVPGR